MEMQSAEIVMFEYLNNLKYIFLANSIGIFSGYLLSVYIDNKFFDEAEFNIKKAILWGIGVSLFLYATDFGIAALNYYLSSTFSTNLIFFPIIVY